MEEKTDIITDQSSFSEGYDTEQEDEDIRKKEKSDLDLKVEEIIILFEKSRMSNSFLKNEEIQKHTDENDQKQTYLDELQQKLKDLKFKIRDNTMYIQCQQEQSVYQEESIQKALKFISEQEEQITNQNKQIEEMKKYLDQEQNLNQDLQTLFESQKNQDLEHQQNQEYTQKIHEQQIDQFTQTLGELNKQIDKLSKEKNEMKQQSEYLQEQLEQNTIHLKEKNQELQILKESKFQKAVEFGIQTDDSSQFLENQMNKQIQKLETQDKNNQQKIQELETIVKNLQSEGEENQKKYDNLQKEKIKIENTLQEKQHKFKHFQLNIDSINNNENQFIANYTPSGNNIIVYGQDDNSILKAQINQPQKISDFYENEQWNSQKQQYSDNDDDAYCRLQSGRNNEDQFSPRQFNKIVDHRTTTDPSPLRQEPGNFQVIQFDRNIIKESILSSTSECQFLSTQQQEKDQSILLLQEQEKMETDVPFDTLESKNILSSQNKLTCKQSEKTKIPFQQQQRKEIEKKEEKIKKRDQNLCGCNIM